MGLINFRGAFAGAGGAMEASGMAILKSTLDQQREERLANLRAQSAKELQASGFEHDVSMEKDVRQPFQAEQTKSGQGFTRSMETDVRQPFQASQQKAAFGHAETMQETSIEAAASEGRLNREVTRAGQGIQQQQVDILAKGAELDREIKQITINNSRTVEALKTKLLSTADPKEKADITDTIHILTGKDKDKFLPVPLKDDMGNVTGYKIFDTVRGVFADSQPGASPYPEGTELRGKDGKAYVVRGGQPILKGSANEPTTQAPAPLISEPPGSNPPYTRGKGLLYSARERQKQEQERLDARKEEYGNAGY